MSLGAVLFGVAVLSVVVAYLARPFRLVAGPGLDRTIEAWVTQVRAREHDQQGGTAEGARAVDGRAEARNVSFCHQCGQAVEKDDRFCSACGTRLRGRQG